MSDIPRLGYTVDELAKSGIGRGRTKIFEDIRNGKLRAKKNGRSTIITPEDAKAYVASLPDVRREVA